MAFTQVTVTGSYGASATGQVTFTLTQPMANAGTTMLPEPIVAELVDGAFSVELPAVDDPETVPQGVLWGVTETIAGAQPRDYAVLVGAASAPTVDISALMPGQLGWT